ncbi:hypothetical protein BDV93DRAFT_527065 [Ceratobasidium sp. AG-I]|nr:hypothetical protein BDV93DRAFT_527065 [Ceratobasidium sp. AG-I]
MIGNVDPALSANLAPAWCARPDTANNNDAEDPSTIKNEKDVATKTILIRIEALSG